MKITHLFLLAVALLFLVSSGFARKPRKRRECYEAEGRCQLRKCRYPLVKGGRCGFTRRCCVSKDNDRFNGERGTWNLWDSLKY